MVRCGLLGFGAVHRCEIQKKCICVILSQCAVHLCGGCTDGLSYFTCLNKAQGTAMKCFDTDAVDFVVIKYLAYIFGRTALVKDAMCSIISELRQC